MRLSSLVARAGRAVVGAALAMVAASGDAAAPDWETLPRLTDVRHEHAAVLTEQVAGSGSAALDLPWSVNVQGHPARRILVGKGWLRFMPDVMPQATLEGAVTATGDARDAGGSVQLDVLAGSDVSFGPLTKVLATVETGGLAVRWVALQTPIGLATVEAIVDRMGRVTVQQLSLPRGIEMLDVRAGLPGAPLHPVSASSRRMGLGPVAVLDPPRMPSVPHRSDPPPSGCTPETGTWCDRADGPGTSEVWLSEDFDDLDPASRGWTLTDLWHPIPYAVCPPGATANPGGSTYYGIDGACTYNPSQFGSLVSPPFGPVTTGSQFVFSSRIGLEANVEIAQIYVNGTLIGNMPTTLNPDLWYNFNPIDLSPWAGQMVQIEFFFQSDASLQDLGWMVDDVIAWNPTVGNPDCMRNAGHGNYSACDDRQGTRWTFNESAFCKGCIYTFYVLVECGREMHLPLEDIEGVDLQITNVVDPTAPPPLHCINQTARADAGLAPYPTYFVPDANGVALDCCAPTGAPEAWYSPAFDVTDSAGPGRVTWGLADGCPVFLVYDDDVPANGVDCTELPPTCGGVLSRVSPGEAQVVDCYIEDPIGLCGLYRVDVVSGGNVWSLFANCDGTNTPQFPIFFDCTEAWLAYNPLPELAVANLVVQGTCPDLTVDFDVINTGCADHAGDAVARIVASGADASCGGAPTTIDVTITGPISPGSVHHVTRTISAPCSPARVDVSVDPDNLVAECTETPGAAACRTDTGLNTITSFTCGCTAQLTADAGFDQAGCTGETIRLDASASTIAPCASPQYRWLDDAGTVVRDWSAVPTLDVLVRCPAGRTYTAEVACQGESCSDSDTVTVSCISITPAAGADVKVCTGGSFALDGSASVVTNCAAPIYRWFDSNGNEVRGWSPDPTLSVATLDCANAGDWLLEVGCEGENCTNYDLVTVTCVQVLANAGPDLPACEGIPVTIDRAGSSSRGCTSVVYQWFDPGGTPVSPVLTDPDYQFTFTGCPGTATLVLVAACADPGFETCGTVDTMSINCGNPAAPVPTATPQCGGASLACGVAEPGATYWWDTDALVDSDLSGDPLDDRDVTACDRVVTFPDATTRTLRAWAEDAQGCRSFTDIDVTPLALPAVPVPTADVGCAGATTTLHCGSTEPGITWDFDLTADSDGNTIPDDDVDAATCDATTTYPAGSFTVRVTATAAGGCSAGASYVVDVGAGTPPPEVINDRATRSGSALTLTWDATPGASTYRVSRGTIGAHYDHAAGDPGVGACDTLGATTWTDPDDATDGGDWYYLITAVESCGNEGTPGNGTDRITPFPRDARVPTAGCP